MKALTLTEPWASLVAIGAKRIETRSWATTYRGPLAIHAGLGLGPVGGKRAFNDLIASEPFRSALLAGMPGGMRFACGSIVAVAELVDCWPIVTPRHPGNPDAGQRGEYLEIPPGGGSIPHDVTGNEFAFGDYTPGRYGWILNRIRALPEPIPCRGSLGLWDVPADVEAQIARQLQGATHVHA